jgi:hypothetical protein
LFALSVKGKSGMNGGFLPQQKISLDFAGKKIHLFGWAKSLSKAERYPPEKCGISLP